MAPVPQRASSAIVERSGRLLLIRRRHPPSADFFAFPGGRAEPGESAAETALRELFEETGLSGRDPVLFATYELSTETGGVGFVLSVFRVEAEGEAVAAGDAADAGWYLPAEIRALPLPPSMLDCIGRLEAEAAGLAR